MVTLEKMRNTASDLDRGAESKDLGITLIGSSDYRRAAIFLRDAAKQIEDLTRERDHWKANHDNQVSRARILIERLDLPIERVRAYKEIEALRALAGRIPQTAEAAIEFIRTNCGAIGPVDENCAAVGDPYAVKFSASIHDLLSAFRWADLDQDAIDACRNET